MNKLSQQLLNAKGGLLDIILYKIKKYFYTRFSIPSSNHEYKQLRNR
jgi:hypothetical protein